MTQTRREDHPPDSSEVRVAPVNYLRAGVILFWFVNPMNKSNFIQNEENDPKVTGHTLGQNPLLKDRTKHRG